MSGPIANYNPIARAALDAVASQNISNIPEVSQALAAAVRAKGMVASDTQLVGELLIVVLRGEKEIENRISPIKTQLEGAKKALAAAVAPLKHELNMANIHLRSEIARVIDANKAEAEAKRLEEIKPADDSGPSVDAETAKPKGNVSVAGSLFVTVVDWKIEIDNMETFVKAMASGVVPLDFVKVELLTSKAKPFMNKHYEAFGDPVIEIHGLKATRYTRTQVR